MIFDYYLLVIQPLRVLDILSNDGRTAALHRAGLHPARPCHGLRPADWRRLRQHLGEVLEEAVEHQGSTLADGMYRTARDEAGGFQDRHRVYHRAGERCVQCGKGTIVRIVQAQRSTFYCPVCQRAGLRTRDQMARRHQAMPSDVRIRWLLTPEHWPDVLLAAEVLLWLSDTLDWGLWHKGHAVLVGVACVAVALLLLLIWFAAAIVFRLRFQYSIWSLLVLTLVAAISCGWLKAEKTGATAMAGAGNDHLSVAG